jgi:predicted nucleotidyltransferase
MIYTLDEIKQLITPVAIKNNILEVYIFGSYARGEATENSDVDILIDKEAAGFMGLFKTDLLYRDFEKALNKQVDIADIKALEEKKALSRAPFFVENVTREMIKIYG